MNFILQLTDKIKVTDVEVESLSQKVEKLKTPQSSQQVDEEVFDDDNMQVDDGATPTKRKRDNKSTSESQGSGSESGYQNVERKKKQKRIVSSSTDKSSSADSNVEKDVRDKPSTSETHAARIAGEINCNCNWSF